MIGFLLMIKFKFEAKAHFTLDHWKGESLKIPVKCKIIKTYILY